MRRVLHLLIALTLLWCGLHSDNAAHAHEDSEQHQLVIDIQVAPEDFDGAHGGPSNGAHAGHHHHCPVAPDPVVDPFQCAVGEGENLLTLGESRWLTSRSRAPPLQPPSA